MRQRFRAPDQYGLVLALILVSLIAVAAVGNSMAGRIVAEVLLAGALLFAMRTSGVRRGALRMASIIVALAIVVSALANLAPATLAIGVDELITASLVIMTPVVIGRRLAAEPDVTLQKVLGALCIYLLIGVFFSYLFQLISWASGDPFFARHGRARVVDYVYFSYATITTVGYGDFTAGTDLGRMLAISEALLGQLYLVTVVAVLVSRMRIDRQGR